MAEKVVVLGAGYAGAGAIPELESELPGAELVWISDNDYHLVLHESHRVIRDPSVQEKITIPVEDIKSPSTEFVQGTVEDVDVAAREVSLDDGTTVDYDYLLVALGSGTAYYGIPGMEEYAHTLKSLDDALAIHDAVADAARQATRSDPAQVVIGGAGLSGIQSAGEVAEYRDRHNAPIDITLVEAMDDIMPGQSDDLQRTVRRHLEDAGVDILTNDPITEATEDAIFFDERDGLDYDVLLWTGGISGREALGTADLDKEHNRLNVSSTFQTSDDRVFAIGDTALVEQDDGIAPPTAQAAWQAAKVVATNVANAIDGRPLERWTFTDRGTLISVGETAVAHDVGPVPVTTFNDYPAKFLKKFVAARWIADLTGWGRAVSAWDSL
ncbi:NAD(P)/FAD-dependent oxidoreductase [Halobacteriaceae archaeon GCM10025711]